MLQCRHKNALEGKIVGVLLKNTRPTIRTIQHVVHVSTQRDS